MHHDSLESLCFSNFTQVMTQLTVSIEDNSMLEQIKQAISLIRGVSSVTLMVNTGTHSDLFGKNKR